MYICKVYAQRGYPMYMSHERSWYISIQYTAPCKIIEDDVTAFHIFSTLPVYYQKTVEEPENLMQVRVHVICETKTLSFSGLGFRCLNFWAHFVYFSTSMCYTHDVLHVHAKECH
jgi:hypothetical protein